MTGGGERVMADDGADRPAPFRTADPLITALGPIRWRASDDLVEMSVEPEPTALNAGGALHGGALSAWLDMAMYELARRRLGACVTISMSVQFLDAGARAPLALAARFSRAGRGMAFCVAEALQDGRGIAHGTAIYKKTGAAP